MSDLDKLADLQKKVASMQREADKAQGSLERLMVQLKEDFDCDTIEEAKELLEALTSKEEKAKAAFSKALTAFEEKYADDL